MTTTIDYYQVLGVIPSAEAAVIKAAYKALVSTYHPDKNPEKDTSDKIKEINIAYAILSEPAKRKEYDKSREPAQHNASSSEFDQTGSFTTDPLEKDWAIAVSFYPNIKRECEDLEKISWRLAFAFKLQLLGDQKYENSSQVARKLKLDYLNRYFGKDKDILAYAEQLIKARQIEVALYLNKIINVMGRSVSYWDVKNKIDQKYPKTTNILYMHTLYFQVKENPYNDFAASQLVELHGGTVRKTFFTGITTVQIDNREHEFYETVEFCKFILTYFAEKYA